MLPTFAIVDNIFHTTCLAWCRQATVVINAGQWFVGSMG